jgi:cytochrome P450
MEATASLNVAVTLMAAVLIPIGLIVMLRRRRRPPNCQIPRCVPCGLIETTRRMNGPDSPAFALNWAKELGFVFRINILYPSMFFVIGDPVVARAILSDPTATRPSVVYEPIETMAGASTFVSSSGERWRHVRQATMAAFAPAHMTRMKLICKDKLEHWVRSRLEGLCRSNQTFDPEKEMAWLTLPIICEAAFDYEMNEDEAKFFKQEWEIASEEYVLKQGLNPLRASWLGHLFAHRDIERAKLASQNGRDIGRKILQSHRNNRTRSVGAVTVIECIDMDPEYENDDERIADILAFMVAGHETTSYTLAWTLLELARNPHESERLRNELQSLSSEEERVHSTALKNVVKESMRLHPVDALGAVRQVHQDVRVDDTTIIPKGSITIWGQLLIFRNPKYFDHPDQFLPDRWNSFKDTAFLPFGHAPHSCLGRPLAEIELHSVIARLAIDYEFELVDPGKPLLTLHYKPSEARLKVRKVIKTIIVGNGNNGACK